MSDGTLRALGILVALLQSGDGNGAGPYVPLVGIEEPELALHPAAAGVFIDRFREASRNTQVLVTSHSPDLLDNPQLDTDAILAVVADAGTTTIGSLDEAGKSALRDRLYTAGELLRLDQLAPDPAAKELSGRNCASSIRRCVMRLACIVEGHGEVQAVPILLRRMASALDPNTCLQVEHPIRITKSKLLQAGELERAVELAARKVVGTGAILILLDSDRGLPCDLGTQSARPCSALRVEMFRSRLCWPSMSSRRGFSRPPSRCAAAGACEMTGASCSA